jgi:uncharacterized damage-inducible protein DinB
MPRRRPARERIVGAIDQVRIASGRRPCSAIPERDIPRARTPILQHVVDTYASEINKVVSVWTAFTDSDLDYRPHPRSSTVEDNFKHQLLSERRFFGEILHLTEPPAAQVGPPERTVSGYRDRLVALSAPRLAALATADPDWWTESVPFFDVSRERIWIFWRRVLHTAHHRTQLAVCLRLLDRAVPPIYGPTADVSWSGADPTTTVDAASRR